MRKYLFILLSLFIVCKGYGQTKYKTYQLKGIGTIEIAQNMKLLSEEGLGQQVKDFCKGTWAEKSAENSSRSVEFTFTSKEPQSKNEHSLMIISKAMYDGSFDFSGLEPKSKEEIELLNQVGKSWALSEYEQAPFRLTKWNGTSIISMKENKVLKSTFERILGDNLPVYQETYFLAESQQKQMYKFVFSCPKEEQKYWKPIFKHTILSLRLK